MRGSLRSASLLPLLGLLASGIPTPVDAGEIATPRGEPVRGIVLSTHTDSSDWASEGTPAALDQMRQLGAGWVAIHPYAAIRADGGVQHRPLDPQRPPEYLRRPIREAHQRGMKILIKPHIGYWGSPFRWRGEIHFVEPAARRRFWSEYTRWILTLAETTAGADGFVVGTELDRTLDAEAEWRELIARLRQRISAPLTYAANWTDYERVPFWDALDAIGIQAYFPLVDFARAPESELRRGWERWMGRLRSYARQQNRVVVFTELGYNRAFSAAVRPWEDRTDGEAARLVQEACLRAALSAIESEPLVVGAFLWKWFPGPAMLGRNFQLATPGMQRVIREAWSSSP